MRCQAVVPFSQIKMLLFPRLLTLLRIKLSNYWSRITLIAGLNRLAVIKMNGINQWNPWFTFTPRKLTVP